MGAIITNLAVVCLGECLQSRKSFSCWSGIGVSFTKLWNAALISSDQG